MKTNKVLIRKKVKESRLQYIKRLAYRILEVLNLEKTELSILLTSDDEIKELNRLYRGQDKTTDVLSFPMGDEVDGWKVLGDVVISLDTAKRQAQEHGLTLEEEIKRLLIHGILHLLGYDHELSEEEERRFRLMEGYVQSKIEPPASR